MESKKIKVIMFTAIIGISLLCGCSSSQNSLAEVTTETTTETTMAATEVLTYGEEQENAYQVYVTNNMGESISSLELETEDMDSVNILGDAGEIALEEKVLCYFPNGEGTKKSCKLKVKLTNNEEYELSAFDISDMDEVSLCFENEVGYIVYTSKSTGEEVKTKAEELEIKKLKNAVADFSEKLNAVKDEDENLEETVTALRETYDAFTEEQKKLVDEKDIMRLEELEGLVEEQKKKQQESVPATTAAPAPAPAPAEPSGGGCLDDVIINEW